MVSSVVKGRRVLVGALGVTRVTGLSLLLGNPVCSEDSWVIGRSVSKVENGNLLFNGLPWLLEALGCSTGSGLSLDGSSRIRGLRARLPVGTILTLVLVRPPVEVGPVGGMRALNGPLS